MENSVLLRRTANRPGFFPSKDSGVLGAIAHDGFIQYQSNSPVEEREPASKLRLGFV
ncbi:hypothetical protein [Thermoleptolyngbya sp. M55_K2018_002]|uniref:hypothetical protein n=1 Tax=Thermoleptolyngbya sp. M55_K2018_002 TaxID=2747808 RepID=UPI0019F13AA2|nr:hypothetical protein [Thermoleptolyngbya sp. M55_K2018_002]HIK42314.1 hypothetical protein [Thermoleptolyngbya sp. M55_K2018_002]